MHRHLTRRQFLKHTAVGPSLVCSLVNGWHDLLATESQAAARYDLLVRGGRVIDPSQGLSGERDVAISGSKITKIAANIAETEARQILNARGKIVTPGLIDIQVKLPLMAHIGDTQSQLRDILAILRKGDVVTHSFHGRENGILDEKGRVLPEVRAAIARDVHLDVGHGQGSFSFDIAEKALKQEILPGTISSDVHQFNVNGPVFDMATTLSKFLHLGLTLEQVIERATTNAANTFGFPKGLGTLREGAEADVAIFSLAEGDFELVDSLDQKRVGHRKLIPVATVKAGKIYGSASIPVVRL